MNHPLGQGLALLTAFTWSFAIVLFKQSGERISPIALNLFKNVVALVLLGASLAVLYYLPVGGILDISDGFAAISARETWLLILSGVIGIGVADSLVFYALNRIGVGLMAIVDCLYSPGMILFAFLLNGEVPSAWVLLGGALILTAIAVASGHAPPPNRTRRDLLLGMAAGAAAMLMMGYAIAIVKPTIEARPELLTTTLRMLGGVLFIAPVSIWRADRRVTWLVFRPSKIWNRAMPGAILGTYICLLLWIASFKYTTTAAAAILHQTSLIFMTVLARLILYEPITRRKLIALCLAATGAAIVVSSRSG